jgi:hypothetical protein
MLLHVLKFSVLQIALFMFCHVSLAQKNKDITSLKVIIIRHAEKPEEGNNLSCQGLNRALALPDVLHHKFGIPDKIFVPSLQTGKKTSAARMYQTIVPFVVKYNLAVDTKFEEGNEAALAASVLNKKGTVLIVWVHTAIPLLAEKLGVKDKNLKWKGNDFDSIWVITYKNGKAELSVEKEGIVPAPDCK